MANAGKVTVEIGADTAGLNRGIADVAKRLSGLSAVLTGAKFALGAKALNGLISASTALPRALAGALGGLARAATGVDSFSGGLEKAIQASISFESALAGVRKTVDASEAEVQILGEQFRQMATEIPVAVEELLSVGEAAGQLGIRKANISEFSRVMAELGVTTNLSSQEAATSLARIANVMQTPQNRFRELGDIVVALGNNFATTEAEIVTMGQRLAAAGNVIGLTEGQVFALATTLSSVGINAEAGGTAFSRVMLDMAGAVSKGGAELQKFANVAKAGGVQDFAKLFREDAGAAIEGFIAGLSRIQESGGDLIATLEGLGVTEVRMRNALLSAAGAGDLLTRAMDTAKESSGALATEATQRFATFESQMQIARNRFNEVAITIGNAIKPALAALMASVNDLMPAFQAFANVLFEHREALVIVAQAAGDMLRPAFGLLVKVLGAMAPAFTNAMANAIDGKASMLELGAAVLRAGEAFERFRGNAVKAEAFRRVAMEMQLGAAQATLQAANLRSAGESLGESLDRLSTSIIGGTVETEKLGGALEDVGGSAGGAGGDLGDVGAVIGELSEEAKEAAKRIADLQRELSGAAAQQEMDELAAAFDAIGGTAGVTQTVFTELQERVQGLVEQGAKLAPVFAEAGAGMQTTLATARDLSGALGLVSRGEVEAELKAIREEEERATVATFDWAESLEIVANLFGSLGGAGSVISSITGGISGIAASLQNIGGAGGLFDALKGGGAASLSGKLSNILGGLSTAGQIAGAAIGVAKAIKSIFGKSDVEKAADIAGTVLGTAVSKAMAESISKTAKELDIAKEAASLLHLAPVMEESGKAASEFTGQMNSLLEAIKLGAVPATAGIEAMGEAFAELTEEAEAGSTSAMASMGALAARARQLGIEVPEIQDAVASALADSASALSGLGGITVVDEDDARAQAQIFLNVFNSTLATEGIVAAAQAIQPALQTFTEQLKAAGIGQEAVDSILGPINAGMSLLKNELTKGGAEGAQALKTILESQLKAGFLDTNTFAAIQQQAKTALDQMIEGGADPAAAFQAIAPLLAQIRETAQATGQALDPVTQEMLAQAEAAGVAFPVDTGTQMVDLLRSIAETLGATIPASAQATSSAIAGTASSVSSSASAMTGSLEASADTLTGVWASTAADIEGVVSTSAGEMTASFVDTFADATLEAQSFLSVLGGLESGVVIPIHFDKSGFDPGAFSPSGEGGDTISAASGFGPARLSRDTLFQAHAGEHVLIVPKGKAFRKRSAAGGFVSSNDDQGTLEVGPGGWTGGGGGQDTIQATEDAIELLSGAAQQLTESIGGIVASAIAAQPKTQPITVQNTVAPQITENPLSTKQNRDDLRKFTVEEIEKAVRLGQGTLISTLRRALGEAGG